MLFTSAFFLTVFLPGVLAVYLLLVRWTRGRFVLLWLVLSSLFFYGWSDVRLLVVIAASILVNFAIANLLASHPSRAVLALGIALNLSLLGYMKYAGLIGQTLGASDFGPGLPLVGISFYTFQQIAFLVDTKTRPQRPKFLSYVLFVTFFPQLIAGPIVHNAEMIPQFDRMRERTGEPLSGISGNLAIGLTIFVLGFFKKIVIADGCAQIATPVFIAASHGQDIGTVTAWSGALAYTMQIYFDFSGYSDMAVGIARMFGIRLPMNFFSPYKSRNIIEFWRRWHMTLSRFLRDYLYIPLGGSRTGNRYVNLLLTMVLGGLWHGAAWSYVAWGAAHGLFLIANHLWIRAAKFSLGWTAYPLTFFCVLNAWVLFKAGEFFPDDFSTALNVYSSMYTWSGDRIDRSETLSLVGAVLVAVLLPNTYQIMSRYRPVLEKVGSTWMSWKPNYRWAAIILTLFAVGVYTVSRSTAYVEFIYFQF